MKNLSLEEFTDTFNKMEHLFDGSEVAPTIWCRDCYPTTIVIDRYGGTYSGANWLAFPCLFENVPKSIEGGDGECMDFWDDYKGAVGKGKTPQEAFDNLKEIMFSKKALLVYRVIY